MVFAFLQYRLLSCDIADKLFNVDFPAYKSIRSRNFWLFLPARKHFSSSFTPCFFPLLYVYKPLIFSLHLSPLGFVWPRINASFRLFQVQRRRLNLTCDAFGRRFSSLFASFFFSSLSKAFSYAFYIFQTHSAFCKISQQDEKNWAREK